MNEFPMFLVIIMDSAKNELSRRGFNTEQAARHYATDKRKDFPDRIVIILDPNGQEV